jgi:hypothetical protein
MKAGQVSNLGPSQHARLHIEKPGSGPGSGTEIDLASAKNEPLGTLIIGKSIEQAESRGPTQRFIYNPQKADQVDLVADPLPSLDPLTVGAWLDKSFFTAENLKEISQTGLKDSWKISRPDSKSDWKLDDSPPNTELNKEFTATLASFNPSFTDVRTAKTPTGEMGLGQPILVELKTFDGFNYKLAIGKEGPEKTRYLQVSVTADLPSQRTPEPNEKPDDKAKKDEAFQKHLADLKQRLAREQQLQSWIYLVSDWNLDPYMKRRDEIIAHPSPSPTPAATPPGVAVPR